MGFLQLAFIVARIHLERVAGGCRGAGWGVYSVCAWPGGLGVGGGGQHDAKVKVSTVLKAEC